MSDDEVLRWARQPDQRLADASALEKWLAERVLGYAEGEVPEASERGEFEDRLAPRWFTAAGQPTPWWPSHRYSHVDERMFAPLRKTAPALALWFGLIEKYPHAFAWYFGGGCRDVEIEYYCPEYGGGMEHGCGDIRVRASGLCVAICRLAALVTLRVQT